MNHYLDGTPVTKESLQKDLERLEIDLLRAKSTGKQGLVKALIDHTRAELQELTKGEK